MAHWHPMRAPVRGALCIALALVMAACGQQATTPVAEGPASAAPAASGGADFACSNSRLQLTCAAEGCSVTPQGEFTPMQVSRTGDMVEVCAYSGCTQARQDLAEMRGGVEFIHADLAAPIGSTAILYDQAQSSVTMRFGGFLVPMECGAAG